MPHSVTRRHALAGLAASGAALSLPQLARAAGHDATFKTRMMGDMKITTLLASTRTVSNPHNIFGINVSEETFNAAAADAGLDPAGMEFFFTPTLIEMGGEKILFDTGTSADAMRDSLAHAGHSPDEITKIVLTHMHGDHISGLMSGGAETFANAEYFAGAYEFDEWDMSGDEAFETFVRPISDADKFAFIEGGDSVASGVTAVETFGHSPGHMSYMIESGGQQVLIGGDFTNHYIYSLANPDWHLLFDRDKEQAAQTRRATLDMLATDKIALIGYHMPFPGYGMVEKDGDGFRWVAA